MTNITIEDAMEDKLPMTELHVMVVMTDHSADFEEFCDDKGLYSDFTADVVYGWLGY